MLKRDVILQIGIVRYQMLLEDYYSWPVYYSLYVIITWVFQFS